MVIAKCMKNTPENSENIHYQPAKINKKRPPQPRQPFSIVKISLVVTVYLAKLTARVSRMTVILI